MKNIERIKKELPDADLRFNAELTAEIRLRFLDAQTQRNSDTQHFDEGLLAVMIQCHNARREIISEDEEEVADELSHLAVGFGKRKAVSAADIFQNMMRESIDKPLLEATPTPQMPDDVKEGILEEMKKQIFGQQFQGDLKELARNLKTAASGTIADYAAIAAGRAETALRDLLVQSDIRDTTRMLMDDFCSMPFCVAKSPSFKFQDIPYWDKNKFKLKREVQPKVERIDPFKFYILNGTTPQNAEACFEEARVTDTALLAMKGKPGWRDSAIDAAITVTEAPKLPMSTTALGFKTRSPEDSISTRMTSHDTRDMLYFHGRVPGMRLLQLGVDDEVTKGTKVEQDQVYEVAIAIVGKYIVNLSLTPLNTPIRRPYQVSSYEKINGSWAGIGVIQRVLKVEKIARGFMYAALRNAAYSATPTGEIDYSRLKGHYPNVADLNEFQAGHLFITDPDRTGAQGGKNAVTFYNVTNNTTNLVQGMNIFLELMDQMAGTGKLTTGDMRGMATLGRSYRGIALVQAAEAKTIQAALNNYDREIAEPQLRAMYWHLLETSTDKSIRGDANIIPRATSGYLTKEANASARQESLTQLLPLAQAGYVDPLVVHALVDQVLRDQGVDVDRFKASSDAAQQNQGPVAPGGQPQQGGAPAGGQSAVSQQSPGIPTSGVKQVGGGELA